MRLLVTGAAGMLGQDVVAAAEAAGHEVLARTRRDLDVTDSAAVRHAILDARPGAVINCAAWTDVDGAETAEDAAAAVNAQAAGLLARAAGDAGALMVHVSTDYVFAGDAASPYVESDPVATPPATAYGRTKLAGEQAVLEASDRNAVVRTAWLFGAGGPNFPDTMLRLAAERGVVDVVSDQVGSPTWTGHLAPALVDAAEDPSRTGTFHAAGAGSCSWYELAVATFYYKGTDVDVHAVDTAAFPRPAPRPAYSVLGSERGALALTLPSWRDGLHGHLDDNEETPS